MQATVKLLASDGGLVRVKQAVEQVDSQQGFRDIILPLFQILTHSNGVASMMLEDQFGTLYNFIYGHRGERANTLFGQVVKMLENADFKSHENVGNALLLLSNVVEVNSHAQVNTGLKEISERMIGLVKELEMDNPQVLGIVRKLSARFALGEALLDEPQQVVPVTKATFTIPIEYPGALSLIGRRHNNDHEDITRISILPTMEEVLASRSDYLPTLDQNSWHLRSIEGLLDRHFRLLREDTVGPLRDAIRLETGLVNSRSNSARTLTYQNFTIQSLVFSRWKGLQIMVSFDQPMHSKTEVVRKEWWERSKRMQQDALVCVLIEEGTLIFCVVDEPARDREQSSQTKLPNLFSDPTTAYSFLRPLDTSRGVVDTVSGLMNFPLSKKCRLVEFPGTLLPSFQATLNALQETSRMHVLPFAEHVAGETHELKPPFYTTTPAFRYNLRDVVKTGADLYFNPSAEFDTDTFKSKTTLDPAQADALLKSLSRSLALIQGPPGTGKSFTGVALIKVLLRVKEAAKLGPILCVCYTNHALDQLLEHLVDNGVDQVIRIGSRSKSEKLEDCNLRVVSREMDSTREESNLRRTLGHELDAEDKEIRGLLARMNEAHSPAFLREHLRIHHTHIHDQIFSAVDKDGFETVRHDKRHAIARWLESGSKADRPIRPIQTLIDLSINKLTWKERGVLYWHWIEEIQEPLRHKLSIALESYDNLDSRYRRLRDSISQRCLQAANVIGVTTTGLARQLGLIRKLSCRVLLCEEAGEVLEAHLLTALIPSLQHAILIGDHQQLRPQIQNFELSRENMRGQQYSLDMSLFERLIDGSSSLSFSVLETQRRMHPSISNLIRSTLYPRLQDAPNVAQYPEIHGMCKRLFWLDHSHPEDKSEDTSHSNSFEVEMVVATVTHLMRQVVYAENEVAVLTPYLGQMLKIRHRLADSFEISLSDGDIRDMEKQGLEDVAKPVKTSLLKRLRISTVDNFQGEEAKVVVVSLVRSNDENRCGFLKTSNRINVLLSRAQHGMYIIGNASTYGHVKMWADVIELLKEEGNFGDKLELKCPRHPDKPILVSNPDDFVVFSPEGGCNLKCDHRLPCGHRCINKCHAVPLHNAVRCLEDCPRSLKGCDHACVNRCGDTCTDKCGVKVECDVELTCGHRRTSLQCWEYQDPSRVVCHDIVKRIMPNCGHELELHCWIDVKRYSCSAKCGKILECGHECVKKCRQCDGVQHGKCRKVCGRPYTTCNHTCTTVCHGDQPCPPCAAECEVSCEHSKCYKKCSEPCAPCAEETCASACPHQQCTMPCAAPCNWLPCSKRCEKKLDCGHQCPTVCGEPCPPPRFCQICADVETRAMIVDFIMMSEYSKIDLDAEPCLVTPCGHISTLSSMDGHMEMSANYDMIGNEVVGIKDTSRPFSMEEIKKCPQCRGPLRRTSRYGRIVRRALIDQASKRFILWSHEEYLRLMELLHTQRSLLDQTKDSAKVDHTTEAKLTGSMAARLMTMNDVTGKRYEGMSVARRAIAKHSFQVATDEQPFKRVWDLVQNCRRKTGTNAQLQWFPEMIQVGESLRAQSLLIACDLSIMTDFLSLVNVEFDVGSAKDECLKLVEGAKQAHLPLQEVEGHIFYTKYCAMERSFAESVNDLLADAKYHLVEARRLCEEYAGSTRSAHGELEAAEKMLSESTFYIPMKDDEWKAVMMAMRKEWIGTGHWYTCANGHPFTVGECGRPMQETICPECGSPVGGQHHREAQGVQRAGDLEARFAGMEM